jgi:hypothetical protein
MRKIKIWIASLTFTVASIFGGFTALAPVAVASNANCGHASMGLHPTSATRAHSISNYPGGLQIEYVYYYQAGRWNYIGSYQRWCYWV